MPGDVTVAVEYSTVNYKDAMAVTGREPVIRQLPDDSGYRLRGHRRSVHLPGDRSRRSRCGNRQDSGALIVASILYPSGSIKKAA